MGKERADLGFGDELESFDPAEWNPDPAKTANDKPKAKDTQAAAHAAGFSSREPESPVKQTPRQQRRHRTGRNIQFNIKVRQKDADAFYAISDEQGWVLGETLEHAIVALRAALDKDKVG